MGCDPVGSRPLMASPNADAVRLWQAAYGDLHGKLEADSFAPDEEVLTPWGLVDQAHFLLTGAR